MNRIQNNYIRKITFEDSDGKNGKEINYDTASLGALSCDSVDVTGAITYGSMASGVTDWTVTGDATIAGTLDTTGAVAITGATTIEGLTTLNGVLAISTDGDALSIIDQADGLAYYLHLSGGTLTYVAV